MPQGLEMYEESVQRQVQERAHSGTPKSTLHYWWDNGHSERRGHMCFRPVRMSNLQPMGHMHLRRTMNVNQHSCKWQHVVMSKGWGLLKDVTFKRKGTQRILEAQTQEYQGLWDGQYWQLITSERKLDSHAAWSVSLCHLQGNLSEHHLRSAYELWSLVMTTPGCLCVPPSPQSYELPIATTALSQASVLPLGCSPHLLLFALLCEICCNINLGIGLVATWTCSSTSPQCCQVYHILRQCSDLE